MAGTKIPLLGELKYFNDSQREGQKMALWTDGNPFSVNNSVPLALAKASQDRWGRSVPRWGNCSTKRQVNHQRGTAKGRRVDLGPVWLTGSLVSRGWQRQVPPFGLAVFQHGNRRRLLEHIPQTLALVPGRRLGTGGESKKEMTSVPKQQLLVSLHPVGTKALFALFLKRPHPVCLSSGLRLPLGLPLNESLLLLF